MKSQKVPLAKIKPSFIQRPLIRLGIRARHWQCSKNSNCQSDPSLEETSSVTMRSFFEARVRVAETCDSGGLAVRSYETKMEVIAEVTARGPHSLGQDAAAGGQPGELLLCEDLDDDVHPDLRTIHQKLCK